jgi:photosystem II stability/assembly factor-like uncharacterized protein
MKSSILILLVITSSFSFSQWERCNGPYGGYISLLKTNGDNVYMVSDSGLYVSSDNGDNWILKNKELNKYENIGFEIIKNKIYYANKYYIFISENNGDTWKKIDLNKLKLSISKFTALNDSLIIIASEFMDQSLYLSTDSGDNWTIIESFNGEIINLTHSSDGEFFFVQTYDKLYVSKDHLTTWDTKNLESFHIFSEIQFINNYLFTKRLDSLFTSSDYGSSWTYSGNKLQFSRWSSLTCNGNELYIGFDSGGVYKSTDNGKNWSLKRFNNTRAIVNCVAVNGKRIFAATKGLGLFFSNDDGETWMQNNSTGVFSGCNSISANKGYLFAGFDYGWLYTSTDHGINWTQRNSSLMSTSVYDMVFQNDTIIAASHYVYLSTDLGTSWKEIDIKSTNNFIKHVCKNDSMVYIRDGANTLNYSSDYGKTWRARECTQLNCITALETIDNKLIAGTCRYGIFISENKGQNWYEKNIGLDNIYINSIAVSNNVIFAGTDGKIYRSLDYGKTWELRSEDIVDSNVTSLYIFSKNILAGFNNGNVYLSVNNGDSWKNISSGITKGIVNSFYIDDEFVFVGSKSGLYRAKLSDFGITDVEESKHNKNNSIIQTSSSPGGINVTFNLPEPSMVKLELYDYMGKKVSTILNEFKELGQNEVSFNTDNQATGLYLLRLTYGNQTYTEKVLIE